MPTEVMDPHSRYIEENVFYKTAQVILLTLAVLISLVGNSFSILVIKNATEIRTTTKIPMFSLAICYICIDISFGVPLIGSTIKGTWPYGEFMCYGFGFGMVWFNTGSLCMLFLLNLDRFIAVIRPLHYDTVMTVSKISFLTALAWIFSVVFATLNAFLPYQRAFYKPDYLFCFFDPYTDEIMDLIGMSNVLILIVIPIGATILIYRKIYSVAKIHVQQIAAMENRGRDQKKDDRRRRADNKAAKAFLMVTVGFVLSWLPFIVAIGYEYVVNTEPPILPWWSELCVIVGTSINVVIYYWKNAAFRRPAQKLLPMRWRKVGPAEDETNTANSAVSN